MKTQFFKSALCLLLVFSILLPLGGCGKEKYPTFEDGQYIDTAGKVMDPQEVTLDVYTIILGEHKTVHQTTFTGTGQATEDGYVYLLKFDQSVTFGVVPSYTYAEMKLYYKSEKDIYAFEGMYDVVMKRT